MKIRPGTVVKIYKGTPRFEDGAISRVLDFDPMQKEYLVGENLGDDDHWVKESAVEEVSFETPHPLKTFRFGLSCGIVLMTILDLVGTYLQ